MPPKKTVKKKKPVKKPVKKQEGGCKCCGQTGKGLLGNLVAGARNIARRKLCGDKSRPLLPGENHVPCHNFTGPGTRIDLPEVRNFKPYNGIDACSKTHDIDYMNAKKIKDPQARARAVHAADEAALKCYDKHKSDAGYLAAKAGIKIKTIADKVYSKVKGKDSTLYGGKKKKKAAPKAKPKKK